MIDMILQIPTEVVKGIYKSIEERDSIMFMVWTELGAIVVLAGIVVWQYFKIEKIREAALKEKDEQNKDLLTANKMLLDKIEILNEKLRK